LDFKGSYFYGRGEEGVKGEEKREGKDKLGKGWRGDKAPN